MARWQTRSIEVDLQGYCDHIRHQVLLATVATRSNDGAVMQLCKGIVKALGSTGVPQGGVISPWLRKLDLTEVDRRLERAKKGTRSGTYTSSA